MQEMRHIVYAVLFTAASASAQMELASRVSSATVLATGGATIEMESGLPSATGAVCWLDLPFDALRKPGREVLVDLSPANLFDGPARLGAVTQRQTRAARDIAGLLAANAGTLVEIGAGTNGVLRGRLQLSGELALVEEKTGQMVAVSVASVSVVRRLDGPLRTEREVTETLPALVARCVSTDDPGLVRFSYSLQDARWSPRYELTPSAPGTARLAMRARLEGALPGLRQARVSFSLAGGGPKWDVENVTEDSPVLFAEDAPCERLVQVVVLDNIAAPALAHPALRLVNGGAQPWPAGPAGRLSLPYTPPGGSALLVTDEAAPLRVDRRVKEISRRPAPPAADGMARDEVLAVGSVILTNGSSSPVRALVLRTAPTVCEEASPRAVEERDAGGGRWLRWELDVPANGQAMLEFRYRAVTTTQPVQPPTAPPKTGAPQAPR